MRQHFKKIFPVIAFLISVLLRWLCFKNTSWIQLAAALKTISWFHLLFSFTPLILLVFVKSSQWKFFSKEKKEISFKKLFEAISMWLMMVNLLPFWMGEAFLIYVLGEKYQFGKTYSTSLLTLDQIFEGLSLLCVFAFLQGVTQLPLWMQVPIKVFFVGMIIFYLIVLVLAYQFRHSQQNLSDSLNWKKILQIFKNWASELSLLHQVGPTLCSLFFALCIKALEYLSLYILQWGLGLELAWWAPLLIIAALNLALMIPLTPANLGVFEATIFFIYQSLGVDSGIAMALALIYHLFYLLALIVPGYLVFLRKGFRLSKINS